jgi:hypothetical protein
MALSGWGRLPQRPATAITCRQGLGLLLLLSLFPLLRLLGRRERGNGGGGGRGVLVGLQVEGKEACVPRQERDKAHAAEAGTLVARPEADLMDWLLGTGCRTGG